MSKMKISLAAVLLANSICLYQLPAFAGPNTSPSAQAAAKLKHNPPSGWINHYLPDDRYKIKGGTWKFVSTELDTYYHLPSSPLMLRQSPNIVIGFASAADAEEAGYRPGPSVLGIEGLNVSGQRVTLADGRSTIVLPSGWRHLRRKVFSPPFAPEMTAWSDIFQPLRGRGLLCVQVMTEPNNASVAKGTSVSVYTSVQATRDFYKSGVDTQKRLTAMVKAANQREGGNGRADDLDAQDRLAERNFRSKSFLPTTFGGRRGVLIISRTGAIVLSDTSETGMTTVYNKGRGGRDFLTSIGRKGYPILDYTSRGSGADIINKTFKPG